MLATAADGERRYDEADLRGPVALVVGSEGAGLPESVRARATARLRVPLAGPVESLNVAVAAALVLFEAARQRGFRRRGGRVGCRHGTTARRRHRLALPRGPRLAGGRAGGPGRTSRGPDAPLADRVRPRTLDEILGQEEVLGPGRPLRRAIEQDQLRSLILWGPPGSGKTTLAFVIRRLTKAHFEAMSAVLSGVKEVREVLRAAEERRRREGRRTVVFIDEIHRFNKAQQDALLAHVESGDIVLIGATTENPSFEVNGALLSRSRVVVLKPLGGDELLRGPAPGPRRARARPRRAGAPTRTRTPLRSWRRPPTATPARP